MVTLAAASWGTWSLFLRPTGLPATVTTPDHVRVMALVALPLALRERTPHVGPPTRRPARSRNTRVRRAQRHHVLRRDRVHDRRDRGAHALPRADPDRARRAAHRRHAHARRACPPRSSRSRGLVIMLEPWRAPATARVIGALLGLASAVCYAGNVFVVRRLADADRGRARDVVPLAARGGAAAPARGERPCHGRRWSTSGCSRPGSMTIGAVSGIVFVVGLERIGAARAAILTFAEPLVAVAVGALVWGEPLRPLAAVGGALVLGAGIHVARAGALTS